MKRLLALVLLCAAPAFAEREVFAPTKLAPTATAGIIQFGDGTAPAPSITFSADPDTGMFRLSNNTIAFAANGQSQFHVTVNGITLGNQAVSSVGPVSKTISATSGAGTDIAGASLTIAGGNSTGTASGGALIFQTAAAGGVSGTTANTLTERMRINSLGQVYFGNGETSATPTSSEIRATNGNGTNITGANLSIYSGVSTGSASSGVIAFFTNAPGASGTSLNPTTERLRINSSGDVFVGNGQTNASPVEGPLRATGGSGSNIAGANMLIAGGQGTGTGAGGVIRFSTAAAGASGSSPNSLSERVRIKQGGQVRFVPLAAAPTLNVEAGDVYYDTGTNKLRVWNGTAWQDLH